MHHILFIFNLSFQKYVLRGKNLDDLLLSNQRFRMLPAACEKTYFKDIECIWIKQNANWFVEN